MQESLLLKKLEQNPFVLAPMAGVTDSPFRSFMKEMGCGLITTELVSVKSLQLKNEKSFKLMAFTESQRPLGIQIFGEDLNSLAEGAKIAEQTGADFIDLNFGCPVPKVVKKGAGAGVLKNLPFMAKILQTVKKSVSLPVSIKVRTGWDQSSRNTDQVTKIAYNEGILWVTLHGRTRGQGYSGQADWDYIKEIKKQSKVPIIGNGDLINAQQILDKQAKSMCQGMMIGRGCLKNPWIFQETLKTYLNKRPYFNQEKKAADFFIKIPKKSYIKALERLKFHIENFYDEKMFLLQYKKFSAWFSSGYPNSAQFRQKIFQIKDKQDVLKQIEDYFSSIEEQEKQNLAYEPSLMQGHG